MSIQVQKQIKDNSRNVSEYFSDLVKWEEEQAKQEVRRDAKKKGIRPDTVKKEVPPPRGSADGSTQQDEDDDDAIERDKLPMPQYYHNWDQYDAEAEADKLDLEEEANLRKKRHELQADKDRILDDMTWKGDGDRVRTTKARPRVKINIRAKGRRPAPVDLAKPKKEEANNYFTQGRFKEAMVAYSTALDYLEKYVPPGEKSEEAAAGGNESVAATADGAGEETEAIALKVTLLSNRAQALIKLEEWREAIEDCDDALAFDPDHHKATLRRGFALAKQKRWSMAARDLERAVANDPQDRKAAAELQMARRNLAEQAKEVRAHAKAIISDSTRESTMPTRRLTVKLRRPGDAHEAAGPATSDAASAPAAPQPQPRGARGEASLDLDADGPPAPAVAPPSHAGTRARQPYVPRSVRIRGRQPMPEVANTAPESSAAVSSRAADAPAVNFYTFEAQWTRNRQKPRERAAQLRHVGAAALPALFRESLDAELVGSILEVLCSELSSESEGAVSFASSVMGALSRTQRFEASLEALSAEERGFCQEVLSTLESNPGGCSEDLPALRKAFEPEPLPRLPDDDEEEDEDDVEPVASSAVPSAEAPMVVQAAYSGQAENFTLPEPVAASSGVAEFSLDGCD